MNLPDRRTILLATGAAVAGFAWLSGAVAQSSYDDPDDLYAALARQKAETLKIGGSIIRVVFADGAPGIDRVACMIWITNAAKAVTHYYGRFPVALYQLFVIAEPGTHVGHATSFGYQGSMTRIHVGTDTSTAAFRSDWVLVHEMVHAAMPDLPRRALWLQEGNATYVEPVARAQIGQLTPAEVWQESVTGMPRGLPRADEAGMDGTERHDRLYWGGAIFWLRAEIEISAATRGARSLRDALRAINRQSGGNSTDWSPEQVMAAGDGATGTKVLSKLYSAFAETRVEIDLSAMFESLGVLTGNDGKLMFDDHALLLGLRRRITDQAI